MSYAALATVRIRQVGGLQRDDIVNTFNFASAGDFTTEAAQGIGDAVVSFYNDPPLGASQRVGYYLSPALSRTPGASARISIARYIVTTNPLTLEPPLIDEPFTLSSGPNSATGFPNEVALCLSYRSTGIEPTGQADRSRGRVYIGPLNSAAAFSASGDVNVPALGFMNTLLLAGGDLVGKGPLGAGIIDGAWSVYSRADRTFRPITDGWVNNAWDTQRRRGTDATSREIGIWT